MDSPKPLSRQSTWTREWSPQQHDHANWAGPSTPSVADDQSGRNKLFTTSAQTGSTRSNGALDLGDFTDPSLPVMNSDRRSICLAERQAIVQAA